MLSFTVFKSLRFHLLQVILGLGLNLLICSVFHLYLVQRLLEVLLLSNNFLFVAFLSRFLLQFHLKVVSCFFLFKY